MAGKNENNNALEECCDAVEGELSEFLRNGLVNSFKEVDQLLKGPEFDPFTQPALIREKVKENVQQLAPMGDDPAAGDADMGPTAAKRLKRDNVQLSSNGLIARHVAAARPIIIRFSNNKYMFEKFGSLITARQVPGSAGKLVQFLNKHVVGSNDQPPAELSSLKEIQNPTVDFHERLAKYHKRRARLIGKLTGPPHSPDSLLAIIELDVAIFFTIRGFLSSIMIAYQLGLANDEVLDPNNPEE